MIIISLEIFSQYIYNLLMKHFVNGNELFENYPSSKEIILVLVAFGVWNVSSGIYEFGLLHPIQSRRPEPN